MVSKGFMKGFFAGALVSAVGVVVAAAAVQQRDMAQEEENIRIAMEFYDLLLNQKDWERGSRLIGDRYVQHNPNAPDGIEGIKAHIEMLQRDYPQNRGEIKRAFSRGDLVALHVHSKRAPELRGNAIVDMFRIEDGKVVEHWDVVQAVPEQAQNDNTMF
jgi:predicted SnoaL-like aldol condensation-catalyzing enzyme